MYGGVRAFLYRPVFMRFLNEARIGYYIYFNLGVSTNTTTDIIDTTTTIDIMTTIDTTTTTDIITTIDIT